MKNRLGREGTVVCFFFFFLEVYTLDVVDLPMLLWRIPDAGSFAEDMSKQR